MNKICIVTFDRFNNDTRIIKTAKSLKKFGYDIDIVAGLDGHSEQMMFYDSYKGFNLKRINYKKAFYKLRTRYGFISKIINRIYSVLKDILFLKLLITSKADLYYCNDFETLFIGYIAAKVNYAKVVYDSHELWTGRVGIEKQFRLISLLELFLERYLMRKTDLNITVSESISEYLANIYKINKPLVIRNTVKNQPKLDKIEKEQYRKQFGLPSDRILVTYIGVLFEKERNISLIVDSIKELQDSFYLVLAGPNKESINYDTNYSKYVGMLPFDEIYHLTSICDIGIAAFDTKKSLSFRYALPNKYSQYMKAGLALLLIQNIESEKIINEYDCGLLLENTTKEEIIKKMKIIVNNNMLKKLKKNSHKAFIDKYNWNIDEKILINSINKIMENQ